jgi:hypothetical protein
MTRIDALRALESLVPTLCELTADDAASHALTGFDQTKRLSSQKRFDGVFTTLWEINPHHTVALVGRFLTALQVQSQKQALQAAVTLDDVLRVLPLTGLTGPRGELPERFLIQALPTLRS